MTQPLTQQQIAGLKELAIYQGTENSVFARLIATIEARDAMLEETQAALVKATNNKPKKSDYEHYEAWHLDCD